MYETFINRVIQKLKLSESRTANVFKFLTTVSYYKLNPYVDFVANNAALKFEAQEIKDAWDFVVLLYRYNIKLSMAIYPHIYLLETTLKTQINNEMTKFYGFNWYKDIQPVRSKNNAKTVDYVVAVRNKYLDKSRKNSSLGDFVENNTTFGYWVALLQIPEYWDSKDIKLKRLFVNDDIQFLNKVPTKEIYSKLISINDLRNSISHHNQIIGKKLISSRTNHEYSLLEIYQNIVYLLKHLNCNDIDWMIGDLHCAEKNFCKGNSFETLYKELEFIHQYEIQADKTKSPAK
jgi:hypothetical protein